MGKKRVQVRRKKKKVQLKKWEISIIKALLADGSYTNDYILALFTRTDRPINGGRISEIKTGAKHNDVEIATKEQLAQFLNSYSNPSEAAQGFLEAGPMHAVNIREIFPIASRSPLRLAIAETDQIECKASLNWGNLPEYARTMAGFANNKGGYILFGIEDTSFEVLGIEPRKVHSKDPAQVNQSLTSWFTPSLVWQASEIEIEGKTIGLIYTWPSKQKPVMCTQNNKQLRDADIYYRYPGETTRIKYGELQDVINQHTRGVEQQWAEKISHINAAGVENAAVMDLMTGEVKGPGGSFLIDEDIIPKINFIKEGNFAEKTGMPALRLIGDVHPIEGTSVLGVRKIVRREKDNITERDVIGDFLSLETVSNPKSYIIQQCHINTVWLPIYFYINQAAMTLEEAVKLVENQHTNLKSKKQKLIARLRKFSEPPGRPNIVSRPDMMGRIKSQDDFDFTNFEETRGFLIVARGLSREEINPNYIMRLMKECFDLNFDNSKVLSDLRYTSSYIDLVLWSQMLRK